MFLSGGDVCLMENIFELEKKILKSNKPDEIDKITENIMQQNIRINRMVNENYKKYPDCKHRKEIDVMGVKYRSGFCDIDDLECDSNNGYCRNKRELH